MTTRSTASNGLGPVLIVLLALVTALEALAIDMYLPGMPAMAVELDVTAGRIQQTLSVFLIGLAIGQGLYGPLLDRYGRRAPLLAGIALFVGGSVLAALAPSVGVLLFARFVQAVGASAGLVAPRAIVADRCSLQESSKVFALLMQVMMIGPIVAPLLGGFLLDHGGWRMIFSVLAGAGLGGLAWAAVGVPETLAAERRVPLQAARLLTTYGGLLRQPVFMRYTLASGLVLGSFFAYIGGSAFIFTEHYGLSAVQFSWVFAANSVALVGGGFVSTALLKRGMPTARILMLGLGLYTLAALVLLAATVALQVPLLMYGALLCVSIAALGLVFGNLTALTMHQATDQAGAASALMGTLQYLVAAIIGLLASVIPAGAAQVPAVIGVCGALTLLVCASARRRTAIAAVA